MNIFVSERTTAFVSDCLASAIWRNAWRNSFITVLRLLPSIYMLKKLFNSRFEKDSPDMIMLQNINRTFLEVAPNGLPSDIAPWLGVLYRGREKTVETLFKNLLEILDRLYNKARAEYVPGKWSLNPNNRLRQNVTRKCPSFEIQYYSWETGIHSPALRRVSERYDSRDTQRYPWCAFSKFEGEYLTWISCSPVPIILFCWRLPLLFFYSFCLLLTALIV